MKEERREREPFAASFRERAVHVVHPRPGEVGEHAGKLSVDARLIFSEHPRDERGLEGARRVLVGEVRERQRFG